MEKREDLQTILPFLPLTIQDSCLSWSSPHLVGLLETMIKGPSHSRVDSGQYLSDYISDMRQNLSLTSHQSFSALQGYALFFDERMPKEESSKWFNEVLPAMACLLLRFPALLELHYLSSGNLINGTETGLRVLGPNKAGIVFLSQVHTSGLIEDQSLEALEVDFANKKLGGGALRKGCVQEEIRFMINPELIAGMLFLPEMEVTEAIEVVGAERFSHYTGYSSSFRFSGDYIDTKETDVFGRRKTRIIAIDALRHPGISQYKPESLLRETNKALSGFLHVCKNQRNGECIDHENEVGVATGNWGCGAYGGDPELKSLLQWLAVSQARRPFMSYYTFGFEALHNLNQITELVVSKGWNVGDLWKNLVKYSNLRLRSKGKNREPIVGFFDWLIST